MTAFAPGEGWAPGPGPTDAYTRYEELRVTRVRRDGHGHAIAEDVHDTWHRAIPADVPALPTEPYTVIRVEWDDLHLNEWPAVLGLGVGHDWAWSPIGGPGLIDVNDLPKWITGFEVLSEPRAGAVKRAEESARRLTAKAVLDAIAVEPWAREVDLAKWRLEFKGTS